ncbi:hypothetical protein Hanom_Chr04g00344771 [Helianthus anomalus]
MAPNWIRFSITWRIDKIKLLNFMNPKSCNSKINSMDFGFLMTRHGLKFFFFF